MPRKQNYSYEKFQRDTAKAAKRQAKKEQRANGGAPPADDATDAPVDDDALASTPELTAAPSQPAGPAE